jgi:hypothetical protein
VPPNRQWLAGSARTAKAPAVRRATRGKVVRARTAGPAGGCTTEIGVEKPATPATSTTAATTLARLCCNGLDGIVATARGLLLDANRGMAFVVDTCSAKAFALAHWLVGGADGGRPFVRCFVGAVNMREDIAGDVPGGDAVGGVARAGARGWLLGGLGEDAPGGVGEGHVRGS